MLIYTNLSGLTQNIKEDVQADVMKLKKNYTGKLGLSLDLETVMTYGPAMLTLGMVPFIEDTDDVLESLKINIPLDFAEVVNNSPAPGETLRWWMQQKDAARLAAINMEPNPNYVPGNRSSKEFIKTQTVPLEAAIELYTEFAGNLLRLCPPNTSLMPWGNGAVFDVGIFEESIRASKEKTRFSPDALKEITQYDFWNIRDLRTRVEDAFIATGVDVKKTTIRKGVHHVAADDAVHQAYMAVNAFKLLQQCRALFAGADSNKPAKEGDNHGS